MSIRIAAIGECMIELARNATGLWQQGFAGDTNNTAIYLARILSPRGGHIDYVTALGDDPFSDRMIEGWRAERIGTSYVQRLKGYLPGLYAIETAEDGERQFFYWRRQSAARAMMRNLQAIEEAVTSADLVYLSGISLAILPEADRHCLVECLESAKKLAFDPNFRPALWPDHTQARTCFSQVMALADITLPTFEDEAALFGDPSPGTTLERHGAAGVIETVVKCGSRPCWFAVEGKTSSVRARQVAAAIDTTGAGDSFNAGYLAARILDQDPGNAALWGHELASCVIQHKGAIMPETAMPDFSKLDGSAL